MAKGGPRAVFRATASQNSSLKPTEPSTRRPDVPPDLTGRAITLRATVQK